MGSLPTGTVTFLFTDIEGSTQLAQQYRSQWETLRERHHAILQSAMDAQNGYVFQIIGDAFCVAFHTAHDGLCAAIEAQKKLQAQNWGETNVKVRMGLHTGSAELHVNDYRGYLTMATVQRVMSSAYGGQVLLSNTSANLLRSELPSGVRLRDMKEHRLKGLPDPERLWQMVAPDLQQEFPPLQSLNEIPNNLPIQLSSFIGRKKEVAQVKKGLEKSRLVTLTGSGGVGKTRLLIEVASQLLEEYPDGVWLVELAPVTDPALVERTVCTALDVSPQGSTSALQVLLEYLKPRKILLTMDNCEHLIDACAQICDSILHTCPDVRVLASSREALGIEGENAYRVPSLSLPRPDDDLHTIEESEAVKLFVERAKATLPDFEITQINASLIAQICQRLDGIALAIELAASRIRVLKLEQIAARLTDVFRLLTSGSRTALPRQQTLRAMIDWSYNLLSAEEQVVFKSLSVFSGGWTLEAAEYVCDNPDMLDLLTRLVDKSLVSVDYEHGEEARYYLLETIRQYAREKLAESGTGEKLREKHVRWMVELSERAEPKLRGHGQLEWLERMDNEIDNIRSALEWSLYNDFDLGLRITSSLMRFWGIRNHEQECIQYVDKLLAKGALSPSPLRAKALGCAAWTAMFPTTEEKMTFYADTCAEMARQVGDVESLAFSTVMSAIILHWHNDNGEALRLFEESLRLYDQIGSSWGRQSVLSGIGYTSQALGDYERALNSYRESLALCRERGDMEFSHFVLSCLGGFFFQQSQYDQALKYYQESLAAAQMLKNRSMQIRILENMGDLNVLLGWYPEARALLEESISIAQQLGFQWDPAWAFHLLGRLARLQGEYEQAREHYTEGLRLAHRYNSRQSLAWCLAGLAGLAALNNQSKKATRLFGAADAIPELYANLYPHERLELEEISGMVRNYLKDEAFQIAYETGRQMSMSEVITYVLEEPDK
jgi:predicted ATPase/class 3 adenylate cyclase/Tfp pilus assembly protein PilF